MKKILFMITILVISITLISCENKAENKIKEEPVTKTASTTNIKQEEIKTYPVNLKDKTVRGFEFSNLVYENSGVCKISGTVKNLSGKKYSAIVRITFYDKDNKEIGKATGALSDIESGQTQNFLANSTTEIKNISSAGIEMDITER